MLIREALAAGWLVEAQYVAPGVDPVDGAGPVRTLAEGVAERVGGHRDPAGLVRRRAHPGRRPPTPSAPPGSSSSPTGSPIPGNLGTILRSAEAPVSTPWC